MGSQILFGFLFIAGGAVGVVFWLSLMKRIGASAVPGVLKVKKRQYTFEAGDNLLRLGGVTTFSGMDIHLPERLPHIFLDGGASDYMGKSRYIFDKEMKVLMGGEFDEYFRLYTMQQYGELALSIFNVEALAELHASAYRYDVEVMDDHVRLILPGSGATGIAHNQAVKEDMGKVAMAIMKQIDRQLQLVAPTPEKAEKPRRSKHHKK